MDFVSYMTFMKHAKKVTRTASRGRPILTTVLHRDNYVSVTDGVRLYIAKDIYEGEEKTIDAQTGRVVERGVYPDVVKLVQDTRKSKFSYDVDVKKVYEAVRSIEIASKVNNATDSLNLIIGDKHLEFCTNEKTTIDVSFKAHTSLNITNTEVATFNIRYMKEILHLLKDASARTFKVHYFGVIQPLQIECGNFTSIILPIRQYTDTTQSVN